MTPDVRIKPLAFLKWLVFAPIVWVLIKLGLWEDE